MTWNTPCSISLLEEKRKDFSAIMIRGIQQYKH